MIPILLIASSFIRQNRWLLFALVAWPFLMTALSWAPSVGQNQAEAIEMLQQEFFYGLVVVTFLASSAIYNEKRSRRIVGVLSKGISRAQYLLALALGTVCFAAVYFAATAASFLLLTGGSEPTWKIAISIVVNGSVSSLWMASLALLSSIYLFPFLAAAMTAAIAFIPAAGLHLNPVLTPVLALTRNFQAPFGKADWLALAIALLESPVFIALASAAFAHRDVTVNIE